MGLIEPLKKKSSIWEKLGFFITLALEFIYESFYFHFFPYVSIYIGTFRRGF